MEKLHSEALAAKEEEMNARINKAVVCSKGFHLFNFTICSSKSDEKTVAFKL